MLGTTSGRSAFAAGACLVLAVVLFAAGCSADPATTTSQTAPAETSSTETTPPSGGTTTVPSLPGDEGLTLDQVRNAACVVEFEGGILSFTLVDGSYQSGEGGGDPSQADRVKVTMADAVAFGDLNGDRVGDAAIAIRVSVGDSNAGGNGQGNGQGGSQGGDDDQDPGNKGATTYVIALVSEGGEPVHAGYHLLGIGARVDGLAIADGKIAVDATVPGPEDQNGNPKVAVTATLRLPPGGGGVLLHTGQTSETPAGDVREITVTSPAPGAAVSGAFTIEGRVTIAPFENNLVYHAYDGQMTERAVGPVMVDAPDLGAPGTFSVVLDLASTGYTGPLFVTLSDLSAADGSILALASVELTLE